MWQYLQYLLHAKLIDTGMVDVNIFTCFLQDLTLQSGVVHAGSSAGSAAAVAARFAPWSLCEDTGGSCRAPAIANGIFGLRPTLGCYNYSDGVVLATFTRDTVGM